MGGGRIPKWVPIRQANIAEIPKTHIDIPFAAASGVGSSDLDQSLERRQHLWRQRPSRQVDVAGL
jgi:hypothetical protein